MFGGEPAGIFVLLEQEVVGGWGAEVAVEGEVEGGVVVLDGGEEAIDADVGVELLTDFAPESLCRRFAGLDFASRKFPEVFELAIATLGGEVLLLAADDGRYYFDAFHDFCV